MSDAFPHSRGQSSQVDRPDRSRPLFSVTLIATVMLSIGWIYPEHREITVRAIQQLDQERRRTLDTMWMLACLGHESRLSTMPADDTEQVNPGTIDYASWPAIAGDHSRSAANMVDNILETEWILRVAAIAAKLDASLSKAGLERHARTNALRDSDLRLLHADPEYATRAGTNNVHFLLPRSTTETGPQDYIKACLADGCELNALGTYAWYHLRALQKAHRLSRSDLADSTRSKLALATLADEAFALHFLQDAFASGHIAGTRGDASLRKGTHDYYNEYGLEARTWEGKSMILKGDAWMRLEDAARAAQAVQASLEQLLDEIQGEGILAHSEPDNLLILAADTLDVCAMNEMPPGQFPSNAGSLLEETIRMTPVPGLAEGEGELPRFRSEVGPFIGVVPAVRAAVLFGGFGENQHEVGGIGALELAVRLGLGLEGVMNESGDGLVFLDLGFRLDGASSFPVASEEGISQFGSILAAIPSRPAITLRTRIPFWIVPFDLLLAAPILGLTSPESFTRMATVAGNGGFIPWQAGLETSFGRFQFVLGREVGVHLYGYVNGGDRFVIPYGDPQHEDAILGSLRSVALEFPLVEYMPFRRFSMDQSSSVVVQLYGSVDIPIDVIDIYPAGMPTPSLRNVWQVGMRAAFRWRDYF
ncbi:MAG: hypothetical protein H6Q30_95 [Bacteroidetes bacterium]|nr:hypothetical protein [Bacteroidota bacterium]